jgi:hypothetical protein
MVPGSVDLHEPHADLYEAAGEEAILGKGIVLTGTAAACGSSGTSP